MPAHDVVVIGGGNAGLCAALAAREHGVSVLVLVQEGPFNPAVLDDKRTRGISPPSPTGPSG